MTDRYDDVTLLCAAGCTRTVCPKTQNPMLCQIYSSNILVQSMSAISLSRQGRAGGGDETLAHTHTHTHTHACMHTYTHLCRYTSIGINDDTLRSGGDGSLVTACYRQGHGRGALIGDGGELMSEATGNHRRPYTTHIQLYLLGLHSVCASKKGD